MTLFMIYVIGVIAATVMCSIEWFRKWYRGESINVGDLLVVSVASGGTSWFAVVLIAIAWVDELCDFNIKGRKQ